MTPLQERLLEISTRPRLELIILRPGIILADGRQPRAGSTVEVPGPAAAGLLASGAADFVNLEGVS